MCTASPVRVVHVACKACAETILPELAEARLEIFGPSLLRVAAINDLKSMPAWSFECQDSQGY